MEQRIEIERLEEAASIFGSFDENIRLIEAEFHVVVTNREGELRIAGEPEDTMLASKAIGALLALAAKGEAIGQQTVRYVIGLARSGQADKAAEGRSVIDRLYGSSFTGMVASLYDGRAIGKKDLEELRQYLDDLEGK